MANAINRLVLYRHNGAWVYDDNNFGRVAEPLVLGASEVVDMLYKQCYGYVPRTSVVALFSNELFPDASPALWKSEDSGGNWYSLLGQKAWLCPALMDYFEEAPKILWIKLEQ